MKLGWTPLLWAAAQGKLDIVRDLVDNGAHLLKPRKDGVTVFHIAACDNNVRMLDYLVKTNSAPGVDFLMNDRTTPAHCASARGCFDSLNYLVEHGADLCRRNEMHFTCFDEIIK